MSIHQISTEYIAIDPDYCYGKPRIIGTRIPVAAIAEMYLEMGQSLEEIDRHNLETEKIVAEMRLKNASSKFQERWSKIRGER